MLLERNACHLYCSAGDIHCASSENICYFVLNTCHVVGRKVERGKFSIQRFVSLLVSIVNNLNRSIKGIGDLLLVDIKRYEFLSKKKYLQL